MAEGSSERGDGEFPPTARQQANQHQPLQRSNSFQHHTEPPVLEGEALQRASNLRILVDMGFPPAHVLQTFSRLDTIEIQPVLDELLLDPDWEDPNPAIPDDDFDVTAHDDASEDGSDNSPRPRQASDPSVGSPRLERMFGRIFSRHAFPAVDALPLPNAAECLICYDPLEMAGGDVDAVGGACNHRFHDTCWVNYLTSKLGEGEVLHITCPSCPREVTAPEIRRLLPADQLARFERLVTAAELSRDPMVRWCPQPGCETPIRGWEVPRANYRQGWRLCKVGCLAGGVAVVVTHISRSPITGSLAGGCTLLGGLGTILCDGKANPTELLGRQSTCPRCQFQICFDCLMPWHPYVRCEEAAEEQIRTWAKGRDCCRCPACHVLIERIDGCNHVTCKCGHEFCWLCGADYSAGHFSEGRCRQFGGRSRIRVAPVTTAGRLMRFDGTRQAAILTMVGGLAAVLHPVQSAADLLRMPVLPLAAVATHAVLSATAHVWQVIGPTEAASSPSSHLERLGTINVTWLRTTASECVGVPLLRLARFGGALFITALVDTTGAHLFTWSGLSTRTAGCLLAGLYLAGLAKERYPRLSNVAFVATGLALVPLRLADVGGFSLPLIRETAAVLGLASRAWPVLLTIGAYNSTLAFIRLSRRAWPGRTILPPIALPEDELGNVDRPPLIRLPGPMAVARAMEPRHVPTVLLGVLRTAAWEAAVLLTGSWWGLQPEHLGFLRVGILAAQVRACFAPTSQPSTTSLREIRALDVVLAAGPAAVSVGVIALVRSPRFITAAFPVALRGVQATWQLLPYLAAGAVPIFLSPLIL